MTDVRRFSLGDLFDFSNGVNTDKSAYGSGIPFANVLEIITNECLRLGDVPGRVSISSELVRRYSVRRGDVLFNRTSETQGEVGMSSTYLDDAPMVFGGFVLRGRPRTSLLDHGYSQYALRGPAVRAQIVARGQGGIRANIGQRDLASVEVDLPDIEVQRSIARRLDDAQQLVQRVRTLIAKKRSIRQGTTQELLTGRTRFPGFTRPWGSAKLSDVSSLKGRIGWQGLTQSEFTTDATQPFLITGMNFKGGAIRWNEVYHVSEDRYALAPEIQLRTGDVLMTKDGTIGKLLFVDRIPMPGKATLNSHLLLFRPRNDAYDPRFLYYQLDSPRFAAHVEANKSGTTFFGISQAAVGEYEMVLPSLDEQRAIGQALADVDAELVMLERRLRSALALKQGMLQSLLPTPGLVSQGAAA